MNDWRKQAACRDTDTGLFFPIGSTGPALEQIEEAKGVCRRCPVREECLGFALEVGADGIWAGTTAEERRRMRRSIYGKAARRRRRRMAGA